eukprot:TRINITY_DN13727_c0_g1_i1.p1 TRINITY_DN13727_c0_g1~~TRINITY_DN13727_c0_g1_i1.p1  ORF type:complete len:128 (+),score=0.72 TRINITY_DN13727_c0_g1_i1:146-529(+)
MRPKSSRSLRKRLSSCVVPLVQAGCDGILEKLRELLLRRQRQQDAAEISRPVVDLQDLLGGRMQALLHGRVRATVLVVVVLEDGRPQHAVRPTDLAEEVNLKHQQTSRSLAGRLGDTPADSTLPSSG